MSDREAMKLALDFVTSKQWGTRPYMEDGVFTDALVLAEALRTALAAPRPEPVRYPEKRPALEVYNEIAATDDPGSPLERLRFFCSLAMRPQDWLDVEPFFDALREPEKKAAPTPRITCGFVDVRFDGERWRCGKCGERMNDHYEEMVKHSNEKDYLELMQRKAAFKMGRDKT